MTFKFYCRKEVQLNRPRCKKQCGACKLLNPELHELMNKSIGGLEKDFDKKSEEVFNKHTKRK